jgi:hypothetical protein
MPDDSMNPDSANRDARLQNILTELSMGRMTTEEARSELDQLAELAELDTPTSTTKQQKPSIVAGLVILLFGAVFTGVGMLFAVKSLDYTHDSEQTQGTVIRHDHSGNKGNRIPIVRYTVDGQSHELRGEVASNSPPAVNSKQTVIYKKADPSQAQIDSLVQRWLFPLIFLGIGALVAVVGMIVSGRAVVQRLAARVPGVTAGDSERFTV